MGDKTPLRLARTDTRDTDVFAGFANLAETVFGAYPAPPWPVWALFDTRARCVAGLQCRLLRLACDGAPVPVAALRNVAVAPDWRGRGLMRDLLGRVLPWCEGQATATLLYAETPELYTRFGFAPLPQHAFEGVAPEPIGAASARHLTIPERDGPVFTRLLASRTPVSAAAAVVEDGGLTAHALAGRDWSVAYAERIDAMIAWEWDGDTLVLVDVVATRVPAAASILGALGRSPRRLRTLFPPDKLEWQGAAITEDTGLMARGTLPPAMRRPFMLPPTLSF